CYTPLCSLISSSFSFRLPRRPMSTLFPYTTLFRSFVILEGQFQWRGEFGGETIVLSAKPGDVTGVLPFSRMKEFTVTGRAVTDGRVLRFPVSRFSELVQKMPELTTRLVGLMSDRIREATGIEQ